MVNGETIDVMSGQVIDEQRYVFTSIRAKEGVEALLRFLALKANPRALCRGRNGRAECAIGA